MKKQRSNLERFFRGFSMAMLVLVPLVLLVWIFAVPKEIRGKQPSESKTPVSSPIPDIQKPQPEFTLAVLVEGQGGGLLIAFSLELDVAQGETRAVVVPGVHIEALRHERRAQGAAFESIDAARAAAFTEATGVVPGGYAAIRTKNLARVFEAFGAFSYTLPVPVEVLDSELRREFALGAGEYELNPKTATLLVQYTDSLDEHSKYAVLSSLISCALAEYSQKTGLPIEKLKGFEYSGNLGEDELTELAAAAKAVIGACTATCEPIQGRFLENLFVPY